MRMLGNMPGVRDDAALWGLARSRANNPDALVLVGDSRMQLDIDVEKLSALSGRPVIQLAIDGQTYAPVLQDLANDSRFRGTVLVAANNTPPTAGQGEREADARIAHWHRNMDGQQAPLIAARLSLELQGVSGWFASELPRQEIFRRIVAGKKSSSYLVTLPDRSRRADYGPPQVQAQFYVSRVLRNYGKPIDTRGIQDIAGFDAHIEALLAQETPRQLPDFGQRVAEIGEWVNRIRSRGGQVVFIALPRSGMVRRIEDVRLPKEIYWDPFVAGIGGTALYFADEPTLAAYHPPDGSHLDQKQIGPFTEDLYAVLKARGLLEHRATP